MIHRLFCCTLLQYIVCEHCSLNSFRNNKVTAFMLYLSLNTSQAFYSCFSIHFKYVFVNQLYPLHHKSCLHYILLITLEILKMGNYQSCFSGYTSTKNLALRKFMLCSLIPAPQEIDRSCKQMATRNLEGQLSRSLKNLNLNTAMCTATFSP